VTALAVTFAALLGLAVGSFLNVLIWRIPRKESVVRPPSHCPACDAELSARDNIPLLSWLVLRGRCRQCQAAISGRYPAVELLTCALFVGMVLARGVHADLPAYLYLAAVGVALSFIDLDVKRLPDVLTYPSYLVGLGLLGTAAFVDHQPGYLGRALLGLATLGGFYFVLAVVKPGAMGWGDVKLAGVLGLYLGYLGWGELAVGAFLGFLFGGVVGLALMIGNRAHRKSRIPFGPFMVLGAYVAVVAGAPLAHMYTHALTVR
jgi:leader peptidase (prepilin peptidase)/N-methyltransferase